MTRTFTVTLEDLTQYAVTASYGVTYQNDCFSCWHEIYAIRPIDAIDVALDEKRMSDIESALSYLIVDEHEDLMSYREQRFEC